MTYCVAVRLDQGLVFLSDSRTNAGVDAVSNFRKMAIFKKDGERLMVGDIQGANHSRGRHQRDGVAGITKGEIAPTFEDHTRRGRAHHARDRTRSYRDRQKPSIDLQRYGDTSDVSQIQCGPRIDHHRRSARAQSAGVGEAQGA